MEKAAASPYAKRPEHTDINGGRIGTAANTQCICLLQSASPPSPNERTNRSSRALRCRITGSFPLAGLQSGHSAFGQLRSVRFAPMFAVVEPNSPF